MDAMRLGRGERLRRLHLRARPGRGAPPTRTYVSQDT